MTWSSEQLANGASPLSVIVRVGGKAPSHAHQSSGRPARIHVAAAVAAVVPSAPAPWALSLPSDRWRWAGAGPCDCARGWRSRLLGACPCLPTERWAGAAVALRPGAPGWLARNTEPLASRPRRFLLLPSSLSQPCSAGRAARPLGAHRATALAGSPDPTLWTPFGRAQVDWLAARPKLECRVSLPRAARARARAVADGMAGSALRRTADVPEKTRLVALRGASSAAVGAKAPRRAAAAMAAAVASSARFGAAQPLPPFGAGEAAMAGPAAEGERVAASGCSLGPPPCTCVRTCNDFVASASQGKGQAWRALVEQARQVWHRQANVVESSWPSCRICSPSLRVAFLPRASVCFSSSC